MDDVIEPVARDHQDRDHLAAVSRSIRSGKAMSDGLAVLRVRTLGAMIAPGRVIRGYDATSAHRFANPHRLRDVSPQRFGQGENPGTPAVNQ